MFKPNHIMVAIDFSEQAALAFRQACVLAKEFDAELTLFHSCGSYGQEISDYAFVALNSRKDVRLPSLRELAQAEMESFLRDKDTQGLNLKVVIQDNGRVAQQILDYAEQMSADLLVLGSAGKSAAARFLLGTIAARVLRHARCPVMLVRPKSDAQHCELPSMPKRILIASDFSAAAYVAAREGLRFAKRAHADVDLLHVVDVEAFLPFKTFAVRSLVEEWTKEITKEAKQNLSNYLDGLTEAEDVIGQHIVNGKPANEIAAACRRYNADLVIIGAHGLSNPADLILGSTAERVAEKAPCPVLILK